MREDMVKKILKLLFDAPVSSKEFLVDREDEINSINLICSFQPFGVYGVCGETGIGKTTVLNFIEAKEGKRIYLKLTEKESKEIIIGDMLYKLTSEIMGYNDRDLSKLAEKAKEFVIEERSETDTMGVGGRVIIGGEYSKSITHSRKFNVYLAYEFLNDILELLLRKYGRVILLIDELDKERKEDVLIILDSLKSVFNKDNLVVIISLPFAIYREYARDRLRWNESGNLENILKDVFFLEPMSDEQIQEMILKRLKDYPDFFDGDALYEIARYSDGNPRDALWISQRIVLNNLDRHRITGDIAKETIKREIRKYFEDVWELTDIQEKVLNVVARYGGSRSSLVKRLEENGIKRQTAYTYINRLKENGLIIERNGKLKVSGKIYYLIID